jgi:MSHA biogenesis protein MshI
MNLSFKSLWSRNPDGWSAIDLQGGVFGVNVRLPRQAGQKPAVLVHVGYPGQAVDGAVLAQMGRLLAPARFNVVALLGRHDYQVVMADKPAVRPDEMESSLRLAVSPMIDYPVAEASLAWLDIPARQTMGNRIAQLYAVTARAERVNACSELFEQARMRLDALDIRESAQRNISWLLGNDKAATCMIYADAEGVQLTVTYRGELYLVRFIGESLFDKAGQPELLSQAIDRLALEIQRSFDFVRRNYPAITIDALHVAPTATDIGLADLLQVHLIEAVRVLDLSSLFDWPAGSELQKPQVQAQYFHALGAALRIQARE